MRAFSPSIYTISCTRILVKTAASRVGSFISSAATDKFTAGAEVPETDTVTSMSGVLVQGHAGMAGGGGDCGFLFLISLK